jgi:hypothetical protein
MALARSFLQDENRHDGDIVSLSRLNERSPLYNLQGKSLRIKIVGDTNTIHTPNRAAFVFAHRRFFCWWFPESPYTLGLTMRASFGTNDE